jgi:hypothetical protein
MFPGYVLVGTDDMATMFDRAIGVHGVLKFLKNEGKFQKIELSEISRLVYMADNDGVIGESVVTLEQRSTHSCSVGFAERRGRLYHEVQQVQRACGGRLPTRHGAARDMARSEVAENANETLGL